MSNRQIISKKALVRDLATMPQLELEAPTPPPDEMFPAELDDMTTAYVLSMREPFDLLRQAISQLAGLMVMVAAGAKGAAHQPMLDRAIEAGAEADEVIRSASPPRRAEHHHRHMLRANRALAAALKASGRGLFRPDDEELDAIIVPLRAAHSELQHAAGALPGFETVDLSQSCCARPAGHHAGSLS